MKKLLFIIIILLIIVIIICLCSKQNRIELGTYTTDDGMTQLTLQADNQFYIVRSVLSYSPTGKYSIEGKEIVLISGEDQYLFSIKEDKLIFKSGVWLENFIETGTKFNLSKTED